MIFAFPLKILPCRLNVSNRSCNRCLKSNVSHISRRHFCPAPRRRRRATCATAHRHSPQPRTTGPRPHTPHGRPRVTAHTGGQAQCSFCDCVDSSFHLAFALAAESAVRDALRTAAGNCSVPCALTAESSWSLHTYIPQACAHRHHERWLEHSAPMPCPSIGHMRSTAIMSATASCQPRPRPLHPSACGARGLRSQPPVYNALWRASPCKARSCSTRGCATPPPPCLSSRRKAGTS